MFALQLSAQDSYKAVIDIEHVKNDKVKVEVETPQVEGKNLLFIFPKVVPGTYDNSSFGRFISNFKAFKENGKKLRVKKNDINSYKIRKASKLGSVEYWVDDTWDFNGKNYIFQPGGTNIEANEEFVLNNFGFFGYLRAKANAPYQVTVLKPKSLYGATSLKRKEATPSKDVFVANNYVDLVDQPILYAKPDTISYMEGGAKVGIAVYSPGSVVSADFLKSVLQPLTKATSFVLGNIPTDEYWFLFHFFDFDDPIFNRGGGGYGALEHNKSSFYYIPIVPTEEGGIDSAAIAETVSSIGAHEFLHVLSPLNLHSEEIAYFDFYDTKMSEHLWLYEGVTEYLSNKSRLLGGLIDMPAFLEETEGKIRAAKRYKDISFTEMSKNILDEEMSKQYGNVYQKGALIAMLLDVEIAVATNGEKDLVSVVLELIDKYGMDHPFKDDELFGIIEGITGPNVRQFFKTYVEGDTPLAYDEILNQAGLSYKFDAGEAKFTFEPFQVGFDNETMTLVLTPAEGNPAFSEPIAIRKINGEELSMRLFRTTIRNPESDAPVKLTILEDGQEKEIEMKPHFGKGDKVDMVRVLKDMTPTQKKIYDKLFTKIN